MSGEGYAVRRVGSSAVVTMPAEVDAMNADEVREAILSAAGPDVPDLIIDMSGTEFCDSAGVHAVIAAHRQGAETGTRIRLVATAVMRVFALVGADLLMPVYTTLEAALADTPPAPAGPGGPGHEPGDGPAGDLDTFRPPTDV
jgi:anti-sigma B factor antagonist